MDVNWLKTMHFAEGSCCSMLWISSPRASSFVLLWKEAMLMRLRILRFLNLVIAVLDVHAA